ncbi:hypothetical protein FPZ11_17830 [Humibacter ginsenosidimutans]|uniref:Uncharacterized protein n=1 Tax=Humibacter ginsenosidimutans TaxID=2599293 RepID=A0A5B8M8I8_9MICO|nr:hypothetical protein FPZ11_17830 [Humibacter ginsenosidimutans]
MAFALVTVIRAERRGEEGSGIRFADVTVGYPRGPDRGKGVCGVVVGESADDRRCLIGREGVEGPGLRRRGIEWQRVRRVIDPGGTKLCLLVFERGPLIFERAEGFGRSLERSEVVHRLRRHRAERCRRAVRVVLVVEPVERGGARRRRDRHGRRVAGEPRQTAVRPFTPRRRTLV